MEICIPKPQNEKEFVNLYDTVVTALGQIDPEIDSYLFEANIGDDYEFEAIVALLNSYYGQARNMRLIAKESGESFWQLMLEV